jgi:hypothetical protein
MQQSEVVEPSEIQTLLSQLTHCGSLLFGLLEKQGAHAQLDELLGTILHSSSPLADLLRKEFLTLPLPEAVVPGDAALRASRLQQAVTQLRSLRKRQSTKSPDNFDRARAADAEAETALLTLTTSSQFRNGSLPIQIKATEIIAPPTSVSPAHWLGDPTASVSLLLSYSEHKHRTRITMTIIPKVL